jgi:hypothetical protein
MRLVRDGMVRRNCIDLLRRRENINIHSPQNEKSKKGQFVSWAVVEGGVTGRIIIWGLLV